MYTNSSGYIYLACFGFCLLVAASTLTSSPIPQDELNLESELEMLSMQAEIHDLQERLKQQTYVILCVDMTKPISVIQNYFSTLTEISFTFLPPEGFAWETRNSGELTLMIAIFESARYFGSHRTFACKI